MQINGLSQVHGAQSIQGPHRTQASTAPAQTEGWNSVDQLDISQEADMVSRVQDLPEIRADRVAEIRAQIAEGVYETDEKLDVAVGRLLDELSG